MEAILPKSDIIKTINYLSERGKIREAYESGKEIHLCLCSEDECGENITLDLGIAPKDFIKEVLVEL